MYMNVNADLFQHSNPNEWDKIDEALSGKKLEIHRNNPSEFVQAAVARYGRLEDLNYLIDSEYPFVLSEIAIHEHKEHLDKLVEHNDFSVRLTVATVGDDSHLDKLVDDEVKLVRAAVALRGREKDLDHYVEINDESLVLGCVLKHGRDKDCDALINHQDPNVRVKVVEVGRMSDLVKTLFDDDQHVRETAEKQLAKLSDVKAKMISDLAIKYVQAEFENALDNDLKDLYKDTHAQI